MPDVHDLQVSECFEAPGPAFHAYAAPLEAAEGLARDGGLMRVDPDSPGLDRSRHPLSQLLPSKAADHQGREPASVHLSPSPRPLDTIIREITLVNNRFSYEQLFTEAGLLMRFGLIGCGWIVERDHIPAMLQSARVEIAATPDIPPHHAPLPAPLPVPASTPPYPA